MAAPDKPGLHYLDSTSLFIVFFFSLTQLGWEFFHRSAVFAVPRVPIILLHTLFTVLMPFYFQMFELRERWLFVVFWLNSVTVLLLSMANYLNIVKALRWYFIPLSTVAVVLTIQLLVKNHARNREVITGDV